LSRGVLVEGSGWHVGGGKLEGWERAGDEDRRGEQGRGDAIELGRRVACGHGRGASRTVGGREVGGHNGVVAWHHDREHADEAKGKRSEDADEANLPRRRFHWAARLRIDL
jgi:hypothetical protein